MVLPRAARAERTSADPRSSTLEPHEYFVLSCVDGKLTVEQIVASTGLGAQAERALERLVNEGLLRVVANATIGSGPAAAASSSSLRMQAEQRRQAMLRNRLASMTPSAGTHPQDVVRAAAQARVSESPAAPRGDSDAKRPASAPTVAEKPSAAPAKPTYEAVIDLVPADDARLVKHHAVPLELQRRALWLSDRGADLDPFTMLELHPTADPAQIRRAFHLVSRKFHPDTYYKQDLGSFGPILERLFQRARTSYEALKDDRLREEWRNSLWTEPTPEPAAPIALGADDDSVAIRVDTAAVESGPHAASNGASATALALDPDEVARQSEQAQRARDERAARDRARAQAQQDRLGDRGRQVEQQARQVKAREHIEQAEIEIEAGRWAAAAAALRLALAATPEDEALARRAEEARITAREKRKEELYRILRGGLGSADPATNDPWKRTAMWRELADLDPNPETLSRAADMARERDPVESRAWILRALGMLGVSADDSKPQKERERGQVHLRAARVFFSIGQPHTAEQELKLAEVSLGADHDDVKSTRSLLRSTTSG